ncbi:hypothetical protein [Nitratidesulfovibrio oxamicus]|uniref:hypothetical protein n=1 Tax=Nitratidesulfovibrio oxamicus TaxID=32016 RepID=UPI0018C6476C|nr:hypothetical protein [Nitratidesulfovibrio oxamicus]
MGLFASCVGDAGDTAACVKGRGVRFFRAALVSLAAILLSVPLLGRSVRSDEAMLLANFPLGGMADTLHPLPYYDQASPALYSLFLNLLSSLDFAAMRGLEQFLLVLGMILLLAGRDGRWRAFALAALCLFMSPRPVLMLSEFKHYAFEALGAVAAVTWFARKGRDETFTFRDVLYHVGVTSLGVSTLVISCVSIGVFMAGRRLRAARIGRREMVAAASFALFAALYYLHVKHITTIQIGNNALVYADGGAFKNAVSLLRAWRSAIGAPGLVLTGISVAVLWMARRIVPAGRVAALCGATAVAFFGASMAGMYPADASRHVTWVAGLAWSLVFFAICIAEREDARMRTVARLTMAGLVCVSLANVVTFHLGSKQLEITENNRAIAWLENLPPSDVGLWSGGQPVLECYLRKRPGLARHTYFGRINSRSADVRAAIETAGNSASPVDFAALKDHSGAWGMMTAFKNAEDYQQPAEVLVAEAPRNRPFHIFASHYDLGATRGFTRARVNGLHDALAAHGCDYEAVAQFDSVVLYTAQCPQ